MKVTLRIPTIVLSITCFALTGAAISGAQTNPPAESDSISHLNKGVELARQGQYDAAIAEFNAAIQADPNDAQAYERRGFSYRSQKKYNEAITDYSKSLEIKPDAATYAKRGYTYVTYLHDYEKGIADYEQALKLNPDDSDTQQRLQYARNFLAAKNEPPPSASPAAANQSGNNLGLAATLAGIVALEAKSATAQPGRSPQDTQNSRTPETESGKKLREAAEKFAVGRYAEAFKLYSEAISLDPNDPKAYLARGWAFFCTSQKDAALKDFDEAIKRAPKDAEGYFRRGLVHASASEHEKAVTDFTKAIECRPDYGEAYYERGVSRAATKQFNHAREDFDAVIRLEPKNVFAHLNRGRALLESRETEKALSDFNRAIELSGHEPAVFLGRGAAYLQLGKYEDAQKDLEQAILFNREFVPAYNKLAELFSARKNETLAALNRGRAYFYSHEYPRATAEFERAAQLQPKLAAAHLELGRSSSAQGIMEIAAATDTRHRGEESTREFEKIDRADVHIRDQFSKPAVESLKEAARLDPENAEIQLELGKAYFYWDSVSAIVAFEKAVQLDSKSAEPRFWLGVTKCTWGDNREVWSGPGTRDEFRARLALQDLNAAIEINPRHAGAYYFRGTVHRTLKQYDDAIADFEAAAERASPASHYIEYAAILYAPYKRAMHSVEKVPQDLVATSLKAAALAERAQVYCDQGQYQSALADTDQLIRALPTDPKVFHLRAHVDNKAGDAAGALADLRRAAQLAPGDTYYAHMVEETLKDQARIKGSELSFWEKAVLAMGTAIVVEAGIEMLSGDNRSSTGIGSADAAPRRRDCPACGGRGLFFTTVGLKTCGRCGGTGQY
jgi:tetratricopeptide (TPR) repeat protein